MVYYINLSIRQAQNGIQSVRMKKAVGMVANNLIWGFEKVQHLFKNNHPLLEQMQIGHKVAIWHVKSRRV